MTMTFNIKKNKIFELKSIHKTKKKNKKTKKQKNQITIVS